jgi:hypothetical protein
MVKAWVKYSLIRLGFFAATFILLMVTDRVEWWLAALLAAAVSFLVAYVFFGKLRDQVALDLQSRRKSSADADGETEDKVF